MKTEMNLQILTSNCEITDVMRERITQDLEAEVKRFPDHSQIKLFISKHNDRHWTFDLSMRYTRGHVATSKSAVTFEKALQGGLSDFKNDLRMHQLQWSIETFHFDRTGEYDYYTEVSRAILPLPKRKLQALIVEDDPAASVVLKATLESHGCQVNHFDLPTKALHALVDNRYDLLILDWNLPYMKGGEFLVAADLLLQKADRVGQPQRQIPVVICTSMPPGSFNIPEVSHFFVVNYWHKSLPFSSILGSVEETTKKVTVRNQHAA